MSFEATNHDRLQTYEASTRPEVLAPISSRAKTQAISTLPIDPQCDCKATSTSKG